VQVYSFSIGISNGFSIVSSSISITMGTRCDSGDRVVTNL